MDRELHSELQLTHDALVRRRRRGLLFVAALFAASAWVDVIKPGASPWAIAVRGLLVAGLAAAAWILPRTGPRGARAVSFGLATLGAVTLALLVRLSGNEDAELHRILGAPLVCALLFPEDWDAVALAGLLALIAGAEIARPEHLAAWLGAAATGTVLSAFLARRMALQRMGALELLRSREEARAELADSEARRARAARLAVVGTLAAGVAHEVNNPLAFVRSNLVLLQRGAQGVEAVDRAEEAEMLAEALLGVERIRRIVADLQTFARGDEADTGRCELGAAVEEAVRLSSLRTRGVARVETEVADDLPPASASHHRVVQVLTNLLVNAADAIREGPAPDPVIRVEALRARAGLRLVVEDGGPGLPERVRAHLFEPFVTTKPPGKGTGLGLALAREYVVQMGGSIAAADRPGGGTRLVIELPVLAEEQRPSAA
jgi:signal transduction histidine kinase